MYRGPEYTAERVSDLAPRETLEYVHPNGAGHLPWIRSNDHEKTGYKLKRRARVTNKGEASSTIQVWSYNCESCLVPGRMSELLYTAKGRGADVVCLQGTQMTMETPWTHGQWYVTPVARTAHRAADGVIIAVSLQRFSKESIVPHHVWQPGRLLGVRVKAGQGSAEVDTYFACGYAPTDVSPADVREKFWDSVDRMLRSLPRRTRIVMAIDANAMMTGTKETYPWIGKAGSTAKVETQGWNENGRALYRLLRDHHLTAVNTHGAAQKPTWTHIGPQGNHRRIDYIITHVLGAQSKKAWTDFTAPVALSGYRDHRPVRAMVPAKAVITKTTPTQRPPRWNVDALLEGQKDERYAGIRWSVAVALKKYLDERGGKITDPAGAYNYLEHHMVKSALPHFSQKHESARKKQTPFSGPTLMLVRKKQDILKALALARGNTKFLGSSGDAEAGQKRSETRETSRGRGPCGEGRDSSGER